MTPSKEPAWIRMFILFGAGFFILALAVSAVFDPRIRALHILQSLIYVAVILLTRKNSPWGFGAGFFIGCLWNYTNLFVTSFIRAGVVELGKFLRTGHLHRPDLLISVVAAGGHFLLIAGCAAGLLRLRPLTRQVAEFLAGGVLGVVYFVAIIYTTGPQYISVVRRVFHL